MDDLTHKYFSIIIEKLNISLATQFAIKQLLIEKGIVSSLELTKRIEEAQKLPDRIDNLNILKDMINDFNEH